MVNPIYNKTTQNYHQWVVDTIRSHGWFMIGLPTCCMVSATRSPSIPQDPFAGLQRPSTSATLRLQIWRAEKLSEWDQLMRGTYITMIIMSTGCCI
jgi:hypothetical protein